MNKVIVIGLLISMSAIAAEKSDKCDCPSPQDEMCKQAMVMKKDFLFIGNVVDASQSFGVTECKLMNPLAPRAEVYKTFLTKFFESQTGLKEAKEKLLQAFSAIAVAYGPHDMSVEANRKTLREVYSIASREGMNALAATVTQVCGPDFAVKFTDPSAKLGDPYIFTGRNSKTSQTPKQSNPQQKINSADKAE